MKATIYVNKWMSFGVYIVFTLTFIYIAVKSLSDPYLWYDEAGQFYISKGLPHYAEPFSAYSGVRDVIYYNRYFNLDPGGFSVLLHYWSMVCNHHTYLRLLPFLFFTGALWGVYRIGMHLFRSRFHAVLLVSTIIIRGCYPHISGEIRAYSMEMCGVVLSLYFLQKSIESLTTRKLVILALMLDVFMTSRYGFVVYSFALSLCVIFLVGKQWGIRRSVVPLSIYATIVLCGALFVYFVTMRYQNANVEPLSYLAYMGRDMKDAIFSKLSCNYFLIVAYAFWCHFKRIPQNLYISIALVVSTIFLILSFANLYPWDEQRAMSCTFCLSLAVGIMILKHLKKYRFLLTILFLMLFLIQMFKWHYTDKNIRRGGEHFFADFNYCIKHKKPKDFIFIGRMQNPEVRYLFEEGIWKNQFKCVYPSQLYLGNDKSHNFNGEKLKIDVKTAEDVDARFYLLNENAVKKLKHPSHFKKCEGHHFLYVKVN